MEKRVMKRVAGYSIAILLLLVATLVVHIYMVTRPGKADNKTVAMARLDFKQELTDADAAAVGGWLSRQPGVERYLCNTQSRIVVFSFKPSLISADKITADICSQLNYQVVRYMPSAAELKSGCPVATTSITYKAYNFFRRIL